MSEVPALPTRSAINARVGEKLQLEAKSSGLSEAETAILVSFSDWSIGSLPRPSAPVKAAQGGIESVAGPTLEEAARVAGRTAGTAAARNDVFENTRELSRQMNALRAQPMDSRISNPALRFLARWTPPVLTLGAVVGALLLPVFAFAAPIPFAAKFVVGAGVRRYGPASAIARQTGKTRAKLQSALNGELSRSDGRGRVRSRVSITTLEGMSPESPYSSEFSKGYAREIARFRDQVPALFVDDRPGVSERHLVRQVGTWQSNFTLYLVKIGAVNPAGDGTAGLDTEAKQARDMLMDVADQEVARHWARRGELSAIAREIRQETINELVKGLPKNWQDDMQKYLDFVSRGDGGIDAALAAERAFDLLEANPQTAPNGHLFGIPLVQDANGKLPDPTIVILNRVASGTRRAAGSELMAS